MEDKHKIFLEVLAEKKGLIATTCQSVGITKRTYYNWYNNNPEFKEAADAISDMQVEDVVSEFMKKIQGGDITAMIFYLKTKGRKLGFSEKDENETANNIKRVNRINIFQK
jgi:hypothetical protein